MVLHLDHPGRFVVKGVPGSGTDLGVLFPGAVGRAQRDVVVDEGRPASAPQHEEGVVVHGGVRSVDDPGTQRREDLPSPGDARGLTSPRQKSPPGLLVDGRAGLLPPPVPQ